MSSLHPLLEADEVRPCPGCIKCALSGNGPDYLSVHAEDGCDGTGQLGDPDAERCIEVAKLVRGYGWKNYGENYAIGYSTPEAALAAAREARKP